MSHATVMQALFHQRIRNCRLRAKQPSRFANKPRKVRVTAKAMSLHQTLPRLKRCTVASLVFSIRQHVVR